MLNHSSLRNSLIIFPHALIMNINLSKGKLVDPVIVGAEHGGVEYWSEHDSLKNEGFGSFLSSKKDSDTFLSSKKDLDHFLSSKKDP